LEFALDKLTRPRAGRALDAGEFGPPLKGVEFRSAWFGRSADVVFAKIETMPSAAPGSLGAGKHADLLAYLKSRAGGRESARDVIRLSS
jgi:hypothetical protein